MKVVLTRSITAAIRLMIAVIIIYMINFDATTTANMIFYYGNDKWYSYVV